MSKAKKSDMNPVKKNTFHKKMATLSTFIAVKNIYINVNRFK